MTTRHRFSGDFLAGDPSGPRTSDPHPELRGYPSLLRDMQITRPNQVWSADITYIPVQRGFLYLVAIMDWASRHVASLLSTNLTNVPKPLSP